MIRQTRPGELVDILRTDFQHRNEPNFAWKSATAILTEVPFVRGAWPMSCVYHTAADRALDISGNENHLTGNGDASEVQFGYSNLVPYANFVKADNQYLERADAGDWADITGTETYIIPAFRGMTLMGWFRFDDAATGSETLTNKYGNAGQRSYRLRRLAAGTLEGTISGDGTATVTATSAGALAATTWYHLALRFEPSTILSVFINTVETQNAAAIPASIHNSTATFRIGYESRNALPFNGRTSHNVLCAGYLSNAIITAVFQQQRSMFGV